MGREMETDSVKEEIEEVQDTSSENQDVIEGVVEADGEEREPNIEEMTQALEEAKEKADQTFDQLARSRAELDNLRKRHNRDLENAHKYALDNFTKELLQVRDSMELGIMATEDESIADLEKIREGMALTIKLFDDTMGKFNVERIDPEGQPFNPDLHQAMTMIPNDDLAPNTVVTVVQKGYTLNGRLVRPALVMVSQAAT